MLERTLVIALGSLDAHPKSMIVVDVITGPMRGVMFAGGGTPSGQVIGATDRQGYAAIERSRTRELCFHRLRETRN